MPSAQMSWKNIGTPQGLRAETLKIDTLSSFPASPQTLQILMSPKMITLVSPKGAGMSPAWL